jgi:hypothetical protein
MAKEGPLAVTENRIDVEKAMKTDGSRIEIVVAVVLRYCKLGMHGRVSAAF